MARQEVEKVKYDAAAGCLCRLFWMLAGNALLAFAAVLITQNEASLLSSADIIFWIVVACLFAARYIDIRYFRGLTADGDPASMQHLWRYARLLLGASLAVWLLTHAFAYLGS